MKIHNNKIFSFVFLLLTCLIFTKSAIAENTTVKPYNKIVFFGDSLSDNGNMYSVSFGFIPKSPPYHQGRFSNHIVWSERVSNYFKKYNVDSSNYAVGGLTTILHNPIGGFLPYSLTASMYDYLLRSAFSSKSQTLFVIWVGGNDYLPGSSNVDKVTTDVVANIKYVIDYLIYYGGSNFLVINLPDLGTTPYSKEKNIRAHLTALTNAHNQKLSVAIDELKLTYQDVNIHLFDSNKLLTETLADLTVTNKKYKTKLAHVSESCWKGGYTLRKNEASSEATIKRDMEEHINSRLKSNSLVTPNEKGLNSSEFANYIANSPALFETYAVSRRVNEYGDTLVPCAKPDEYAFWDRVHPSAVMHKILAQNIIEFVNTHYQYQNN